MERQADHKTIKTTKHFISVSNSDSNDFGSNSHNPGKMNISFNNTNMTNVQSYNDTTSTYLNPLSLCVDILYDNVSENFKNNKFTLSTITDSGISALAKNGVSEGTSQIVLTIPDDIYSSGPELATEIDRQLNLATAPMGKSLYI